MLPPASWLNTGNHQGHYNYATWANTVEHRVESLQGLGRDHEALRILLPCIVVTMAGSEDGNTDHERNVVDDPRVSQLTQHTRWRFALMAAELYGLLGQHRKALVCEVFVFVTANSAHET